MVFEKIHTKEIQLITWITFFVACGVMILPQNILAMIILKKDKSIHDNKTYDEARFSFVTVNKALKCGSNLLIRIMRDKILLLKKKQLKNGSEK